MNNNQRILQDFEDGLNPQSPEKSKVKAEVKGYGEISSIFSVEGISDWIFKRLPLFENADEANTYVENYNQYIISLKNANLTVPKDSTYIVKGENMVLYVGQQEYEREEFCHNLLHTLNEVNCLEMIDAILAEIKKVFVFNESNKPQIELSIDGQISNWARVNSEIIFVDTSTPLLKLEGKEQLDPELLLNSTPGALKWLIRGFFLQDVMDRYSDIRLVYIDLIANLYKEQRSELVPDVIELANKLLPEKLKIITTKEVTSYYKEDKFIWQLFLVLRKMDRWFTNTIFRKKYQFILPGNTKR